MAPAQCPSERPVRFVVLPLGLLGCGCLEGGVANRHGDHVIALRGIILVRPVPQVRSPNAFTNRQLFFVKHWCNQQRLGAVLMVDCRLLPKDAGVPSTTPPGDQLQGFVETPV